MTVCIAENSPTAQLITNRDLIATLQGTAELMQGFGTEHYEDCSKQVYANYHNVLLANAFS
jgi:hypothetical protein